MAANFTALDRYINRQIEAVAGYFGPVDSLTLAAETLRARIGDVRLFSVDGGHAYKNVLHDMRLTEAVLADDGVIIVHDFFGIGWPDVSVAAIHLLTEMKNRLQPFLITQYKLFVARPAAVEHYRAMLGTNPRLRGALLSERTMFDRPITLLNLGRRDLLERRIKRKFGFYLKKL